MNQPIILTGKWNRHRQQINVQQYKLGVTSQNGSDFQPVYSVKGDLTIRTIRRCITNGFQQFAHSIGETLPNFLIKQYRLYSRKEAIRAMHFPRDAQDLKQARRRFVYENFVIPIKNASITEN